MAEDPQMAPQTPFQGPQKPSNAQNNLRSIQVLITIATIAAPFSLFFGGVVLSTISLICAIIACCQLRKHTGSDKPYALVVSRMKRSAILSICLAVLALILNGISLALIMPTALEALQTGDFNQLESLYGNLGGNGSDAGSGSGGSGGSVWG